MCPAPGLERCWGEERKEQFQTSAQGALWGEGPLKQGAERVRSESGSSSSRELSRAPGRWGEIGRVGEFQLDKSSSAKGTQWGQSKEIDRG